MLKAICISFLLSMNPALPMDFNVAGQFDDGGLHEEFPHEGNQPDHFARYYELLERGQKVREPFPAPKPALDVIYKPNPLLQVIEDALDSSEYGHITGMSLKSAGAQTLLQDDGLAEQNDGGPPGEEAVDDTGPIDTAGDTFADEDVPDEVEAHDVELKRMCDGNTDDKGNCIVEGAVIKLSQDSHYDNAKLTTLVFKDTKIICQHPSGTYCDVRISLTRKFASPAGGCCQMAPGMRTCMASQYPGGKCTKLDSKTIDCGYFWNPLAEYDEASGSCKDTVIQPGFSLLQHSSIKGRSLSILMPNGKLIIDHGSELNASGTSIFTKGSHTSYKAGASYIGEGGNCIDLKNEEDSITYGRFDMKPKVDGKGQPQFTTFYEGSIGIAFPKRNYDTMGGGRVYLDLDSFWFHGKGHQVNANGIPAKDLRTKEDLNGGSGGYIYIKVSGNIGRSIITNGSVQAIGGYGKNNGLGGSGGIIYWDNFKGGLRESETHGGLGGLTYKDSVPKGCANGASGTAFFSHYDAVRIDNADHETSKFTNVLAHYNRNTQNYTDHFMVADNLILSHNGRINIKRADDGLVSIRNFVMPSIDMVGKATIRFDMHGTEYLSMKYVNHFFVGADTLIDFSVISRLSRIECFEKDRKVFWGNVNLGQIKFSKSFKIADHTNVVNVLSTITDVTHDKQEGGYVELYSKQIRFFFNSEIVAENAFVFANETIYMYKGSKVQSTIEHECAENGNRDLFKCMDFDVHENKPIDLDYLLNYYNKQYRYTHPEKDNHYATDINQMKTKILQKWKVYLFSLQKIVIDHATVSAPRIGICSNNIRIKNSLIDANYKGCGPDSGRGRVKRISGCSGAGASHGGQGGYGTSTNNNQSNIRKCQKNISKPYWRGREARYDGSGGSSGNIDSGMVDKKSSPFYDNFIVNIGNQNGGSGGGVIWITVTNTTEVMNSTITANGNIGKINNFEQLGSGGGSGGSIQLTTQNLRGDGIFSVKGGDGSRNGGGGGAGGRFAMNYLKPFQADSQPAQSYYWRGRIFYQGGKGGQTNDQYSKDEYMTSGNGQDGTVFQTKCFPGYSGEFCSPCEVGTFKSDYSYGHCLPCINKPQDAYYTKIAQGTTQCAYDCNYLIGSSTEDPECLNVFGLEYEEIGGISHFFISIFMLLTCCLSTFALLQTKAQYIKNSLKSLPNELYSVWENNDDQARGRTDEKDFSLNDQCIWTHSHRMYFAGTNSITHPWVIPKDFPASALAEQDRSKLIKFIDKYNKTLEWNLLEKILLWIVSLIYYPCSKTYHRRLRRKKFEQLQISLYQHFQPNFWSDNDNNLSIRLGCSKEDYELAFIDFVNFNKTKETWRGVQLPMPILLAGSGSANHPYQINFMEDPYVKQLVMINYNFMKDKLTPFLENVNSELQQLSWTKLTRTVISDLNKIIRWIEKTNKTMWNHFNVKCVLYVCENTQRQTEAVVWRQVRKSFPLESIFIEAFPGMFENLIDYIKYRTQTNKSEIRLIMLFKRFSMSKTIGTQMRTKRMHLLAGKNARAAYQNAVNNQESVLWDETDKDQEEMRISYIGSQNSSQEQEEDSIEQKQDDLNGKKLVDNRVKAFSYSIDSSKMLEVSIRKPRHGTYFQLCNLWSNILGVYTLFINRFGSTTDSKDFSTLFMLYSVVVAIDVTIVISFTIHVFNNSQNIEYLAIPFTFYGLPFLTPLVATCAACKGRVSMMKLAAEMMGFMVCLNYPVTFILCIVKRDNMMYLLIVVIMFFLKVLLAYLTAKIRVFLANPRYTQNAQTLRKIHLQQAKRRQIQTEILGTSTMRNLDFMADDNMLTKKMLMGLDPSETLPKPEIDVSDIDIDAFKKRALQ